MRKGGIVAALVIFGALAGCGTDDAPVVASDGARIGQALESSDVTLVRCTGTDLAPGGEIEPEDAPKGKQRVVFDADTGSHRNRATDNWVAKAPLYVKIGSSPVEIAVLDEGGVRSRLQYGDGLGDPDATDTSTRVTFLPCGDKKPTWRGYPGAIVSDAKPGCVRVVSKFNDGDPSVTAIPVNAACK